MRTSQTTGDQVSSGRKEANARFPLFHSAQYPFLDSKGKSSPNWVLGLKRNLKIHWGRKAGAPSFLGKFVVDEVY
jgi:hypothetical protein